MDSNTRLTRVRLEMPYIKFPADWDVKIVPSHLEGLVFVQFFVRQNDREVSVTLEAEIGFGIDEGKGLYWEVFPYEKDGFRCDVHEVDELLTAIDESLRGNR